MHEQGFAHRDLKPSNLLLKEPRDQILRTLDATLKLGDLGVVDEEDTVGPTDTQFGALVGTWQYAPPEFLRSLADKTEVPRPLIQAQQGDVYSLGLILYEIWSGSPLLKVVSSVSSSQTSTSKRATLMLEKVETGLKRLKEPTNLLKEQDEEIHELLVRMLDRSPGNRPTIEEVEEKLEGLNRESAASPTLSGHTQTEAPRLRMAVHRARGWLRRLPRQELAMVGMVVLALGVGWWLGRGAEGMSLGLSDASLTPVASLAPAASTVPAAPSTTARDGQRESEVASPTPGVSHDAAPQPIATTATEPRATAAASVSRSEPPAPEPPVARVELADFQHLDELPASTPADQAFVDRLLKNRLNKVVAGTLKSARGEKELRIQSQPSKTVTSPGDATWTGDSSNTLLPNGKPTFAILLRHGDSHYYTVIKGFREIPSRSKAFEEGHKLGVVGADGLVTQSLIYSERELKSWGDYTKASLKAGCKTVAPSAFARGVK